MYSDGLPGRNAAIKDRGNNLGHLFSVIITCLAKRQRKIVWAHVEPVYPLEAENAIELGERLRRLQHEETKRIVRTAGEAADRAGSDRTVATVRESLRRVVNATNVWHKHALRPKVQGSADIWKARAANPDQGGDTASTYYGEHARELVLGNRPVLQIRDDKVRPTRRQQLGRLHPADPVPQTDDRFAPLETAPK
jgi:hypothetical protein